MPTVAIGSDPAPKPTGVEGLQAFVYVPVAVQPA